MSSTKRKAPHFLQTNPDLPPVVHLVPAVYILKYLFFAKSRNVLNVAPTTAGTLRVVGCG